MVSEHVRGTPAPALRPYVAFYSGYRDVDVPPARHRGLPSPYLTLIFTLDDPLTVAQHVDRRVAPSSFDVLVGGLHTVPALIVHNGRQSGIQLAVHPLGARALLGLPAGELAGQDVAADAVLGPFGDRVRGQLLEASTWQERFAVLDEMLLGRLADATSPAAEVRHAWRRLLRCGGAVPITTLAREVGWSSRHLQGRFAAEFGLTPKTAARVMRFDRARRALTGVRGEVADVAAACGYADQSHLVRDFQQFAGCSPTTWFAEEFRNVQDARAAIGTDSGHERYDTSAAGLAVPAGP